MKRTGKKVITGKGRVSFCHVFEKAVFPGDTEENSKYSIQFLIDPTTKKGKQTIKLLEEAIEQAEIEGKEKKWNGKVPRYTNPLKDGDDMGNDYPEYAGMIYFTARTSDKPQVVDEDRDMITNKMDFDSGDYCRVSVNAFPYNTGGNKGVAFGLNNVQKLEEGERLGDGRQAAEDEFSDDDDDELI